MHAIHFASAAFVSPSLGDSSLTASISQVYAVRQPLHTSDVSSAAPTQLQQGHLPTEFVSGLPTSSAVIGQVRHQGISPVITGFSLSPGLSHDQGTAQAPDNLQTTAENPRLPRRLHMALG